jgi:hypothetical protein
MGAIVDLSLDSFNRDHSKTDQISSLNQLISTVRESCGQLNMLMALSDNRYHRQQVIAQYETALAAYGINNYQLCLDTMGLPQALANLATTVNFNQPKAIVTVLGAELALSAWYQFTKPSHMNQLLEKLQWTSEVLGDFQIPLVIWLPTYLVDKIKDMAPDFWTWSGGEFDFLQPIVWDVPQACSEQSGISCCRYWLA